MRQEEFIKELPEDYMNLQIPRDVQKEYRGNT